MSAQTLRRAASVIAFLLVWEAVGDLRYVPDYLLSSPSTIAVEAYDLIRSGVLVANIAASMRRVLLGFSLAVVSGVGLGGLMGWFRVLDDILDPLIELFRPVSPLALLPLSILWLGIGETSKVFTIWYGCIFPVLLNTYAGVRSIPKSSVEAAAILGCAPDEILTRVIFYHSLPMIMTGVRISFGISMIVIIAAEIVASSAGLGFMIINAQQTFQTADLYVGITTIAVIGFAGDRLLRAVRGWICPWDLQISGR